jgi:PAS domain S-box-containing protein
MQTTVLFNSIKDKIVQHAWNREGFARKPVFFRLFVPVASALLATWVITGPVPVVGKYSPFLGYFGVIFFSACYGGSRSALVASIASALCTILFLLPGHTEVGAANFWFLIVLFLTEALLITALFAVIEIIHARCKSSADTYRGIIEKNVEGFLMADQDGKITYVCSSVRQILGYEPTDLLGAEIQVLIHPEEIASYNVRFLKIFNENDRSMSFLQRLKTKNGDWIWIEGCVNNMLKDPNIKRMVFNYRNVTERIAQTKQQEDFVHMAAHELKTPITALRGYLQLMTLNNQKENRQTDIGLIDRMNRQTDRLLNLIDEMLNVTRIRAGELQYHFDFFDFNECVQDVIDSFSTTAKDHQIQLSMPEVPPIYGDKDRVSQVLTNLISNAIKYARYEPLITITVTNDDDCVSVRVKDNGIGIPHEQQKKIFERFYRSESLPKNSYQGLGLGLYIAKEIVKKHQGKMGVKSEPGFGAEFWFTLPLKSKALVKNNLPLN